jgi:hypothetical protein
VQARGAIGVIAGIVAGVFLLLAVFLNMAGVDLEEMSSGRIHNVPGQRAASKREPSDEE